MIELLTLSIGTPLAYLAGAWRYAVWHYRRHRACIRPGGWHSNANLPTDRGCHCERHDVAAWALMCAVWWPLSIAFIAIPVMSWAVFHALRDSLDKSADRPARAYARYIPYLCERHRAERDKRIAELESELSACHKFP